MTDTPNVSLLDREPVTIREANTVAALRQWAGIQRWWLRDLMPTEREKKSLDEVFAATDAALRAYDTGSKP